LKEEQIDLTSDCSNFIEKQGVAKGT
jgi:hypothetical protein